MGNDNDKVQTIKKDVGHSSISGRPNIDEISKRKEIVLYSNWNNSTLYSSCCGFDIFFQLNKIFTLLEYIKKRC